MALVHRRVMVLALCTALVWGMQARVDDLRAGAVSFKTVRSGRWSDPNVWTPRSVPSNGAAVTIAPGTAIEYDVSSDEELTSVEIEGTLMFSRTTSTRLDVGNIFVRSRGVLEIGTTERPIPSRVTAEIRFVTRQGAAFVGGDFAPSDVGLWVFRGGRWDVHGAPVMWTWAKLTRAVSAGERSVVVRADVRDWPPGATVVVTPTSITPPDAEFEERTIASVERLDDGAVAVTLTTPLAYRHDGGSAFAGEVALLTRNVRVVSKYPDRPKAHTMFMAGSSGQIAYSEFRDLGTLGVLGRYPIHFHMMGDSSRGMTVRGASIWRSGNHFLNIHGSNGVAVLGTVGYDAPGSGFFIESLSGPGPQRTRGLPQMKGDRPRGDAPQGLPVDKQRLKQERREARKAQGQQKGAEPFGNMEFVFEGNLAMKGVWRPGSLDDQRRAALFWIGAFNGRFMGNVAVGARGRRDSSGFHFAEHADVSFSRPPLLMLANESHSNAGHGLFVWTNSRLPMEIIDFHAWRNGRTGVALGAYSNGARFFQLSLRENREANAAVSVNRVWIQDSVMERSHVGVYFRRHQLPGLPDDPGMIINSVFRGHSIADVSQDHAPCPSAGEERSPVSRQCPPNYARFLGSQFHSHRAIDFGWHENAHSWVDVIDWRNRPAELPAAFRLVRKDQDEGRGMNPRFDALVQTTSGRDQSPRVDLKVVEERSGIMRLRAVASDDRGIRAVEFLADGRVVRTLTRPPYETAWDARARLGRPAYIYARAIDLAGQVSYSHIIRLPSR